MAAVPLSRRQRSRRPAQPSPGWLLVVLVAVLWWVSGRWLQAGGEWLRLAVAPAAAWLPRALDGLVLMIAIGGAWSLQRRQRQSGSGIAQPVDRRLAALFDHALDAIFVANDQTRLTDVNPAACDLVGATRAKLLQMTVPELFAPDQGIDPQWAWQEFIRRGVIRSEFKLRRKDGAIRHIEFAARAHILPGQHMCIMRDVTARNGLAEELRAGESRMRLILEQMPVVIWTTDAHLTITSALGAGAARTPAVGSSVLELVEDDDRSAALAAHRRALAGERSTLEWRWEGRVFGVLVDPFRSAAGEIIGCLGLAQDVTDRRRTQAELSAASGTLISLVECAPLAIVNSDVAGRVVTWNPAAERLFGWRREEVIGQLNPIIPPARRREYEYYRERLLQGAVLTNMETQRMAKSGQLIDVAVSSAPVLDTEGRVVNYMAIFVDISDRKRAEERLSYLATRDSLTGVFNRHRFLEELSQELADRRRYGGSGALLFIDLDGFKSVNDRWGHEAGDQVLVAVAARLQGEVREPDLVGRLGGDEFGVLLRRIDPAQALIVAERIAAAFPAAPVEVEGVAYPLTVSVGAAFYPEHSAIANVLLARADAAMYLAKEQGNKVCVYEASAADPFNGLKP